MKFMRTIRYWLLFSWLAVAGFAAVVVTGARLQSLSPSMELDKKAAAAFDLTPVRKLIADAVENQKVPSASLLLIHNDKVIFKEAYGYANIEKNVGDLFSIKGKTALVTGGSRGIGLMIARGYVEAGAKVYISSRKQDVCDETARRLSEIGECVSIPADLSTADGYKYLADEIKTREPALHILVNNAGAAWGAPLEEYPEAGWDKVMDTNVKGIFFLTQHLLPLLERAACATDPARVINIGSIDGIKVPSVENYAYSPGKAAVHHLTRVLAVKLGERFITVNAIAPGPFESKMMEWTLEHFRAQIEAYCPLKRIGVPSDMAGAAIYLASRAGAYVNGAVITVDGGICLK